MGMMKLLIQIIAISVICTIIVSTYTLYNPTILPFSQWRPGLKPFPGDSADNLFWFVQVSDVHISRYWDPQRATDFKEFCNSTLQTINPDLVLVTGDLTDAKSRDKYDSEQFEDEWQTYQRIIQETRVTERFIWLDIRGNHDAFDVLRTSDPESNLYLKYSGDKGRLSSSVYHHRKPFGTYSFIPVDATMIPGPRRPYNFMGYLNDERMKNLERFREEASSSNFTIWYSHYPTASITSPGLRTLIGRSGGLYIAGHLHTLEGLSETLYAMNPKGFLELELGDWLYERKFRIVAIDHDMVSFSDSKHGHWPAVVLTNPKPATFMMSNIEPVRRIRKSTHIRFLIFDPWNIERVEIYIDGMPLPDPPKQLPESPLWVCRWDAEQYSTGTHNIYINVTDSQGNKRILIQQFSLDTTWNLDFGHFASFVILTDFSSLFFYGFYASAFGYIAAIIFMRFYHHDPSGTTMITKLSMLMKNNSIFNAVLIFALNLLWGPWFVGEIIRGTIGICFSYGLLINGELQPEDMLYLEGAEKVALFYIPALFFLAHFNYASDQKSNNNLQRLMTFPPRTFMLAFLIYISMHFYSVWGQYRAYGLMAALISPSKLWWVCFVLYRTWCIYSREPKLSELKL